MPSFTLNDLKMTPLDVSGCGDVAYAWGEQSLDWTTHTDTGDRRFENEGTFLMVARRQRQNWLIERLMWDDPPNAEVTAALPAK
jgi:ketosteroid isomerase-like protein